MIAEHYRRCDATVGKALDYADDETLFIVLSDHGFSSFERGVHLNTWLHDIGLLHLKPGSRPDDEGRFFQGVDWSRTKAYALGLGGIFVNLQGREEHGIVAEDEAETLKRDIACRLTELDDAAHGRRPIRSVRPREELYRGPYAAESPDLVVNFAETYRVSWATAWAGCRPKLRGQRKKWSGDHIIDPALVPGVLFMNRPFRGDGAAWSTWPPRFSRPWAFAKGPAMEGRSLLP